MLVKTNRLMKKLHIICFTLLSLSFSYSQNTENPWVISLGANLINLSGDDVDSGIKFGAPSVAVSRYLIGGVSFGGEYTLGNAEDGDKEYSYSSLEGNLKLNIVNDPKKSVRPFVKASYGLVRFDEKVDKEGPFPSTEANYTLSGGVGVDIDLSDHISLNLSTSIQSNMEDESSFEVGFNHMKHIVGFSYGFAIADKDRDGIRDRIDECPQEAGLKEFDGCPDSDGDGIIDKADDCPNTAGIAEFNGCPDSDGDGIIDSDDRCPQEAGSEDLKGCPDNDRDGIANPDDDCPNQAGSADNNGCPWGDRDGDGVTDDRDACPDVPGKGEDGCPTIPQSIIDWTSSEKATLHFAGDSSKLSEENKSTLSDELAPILRDYNAIELLIEGHASSDGSEKYNYELGLARAQSVVDFLVEQEVDPNRLEIVSYGEKQPVANNNTRKGRSANRRVKIILKTQE